MVRCSRTRSWSRGVTEGRTSSRGLRKKNERSDDTSRPRCFSREYSLSSAASTLHFALGRHDYEAKVSSLVSDTLPTGLNRGTLTKASPPITSCRSAEDDSV